MQDSSSSTVKQSALLRQVAIVIENSLLKQTIYSIPWLFLGVCYLVLQYPAYFNSRSFETFPWSALISLAVAFVSARLSGMSWNRLIDATIDARNRRTRNRALPSKRAGDAEVALHALFFLTIFLIATRFLPASCRSLALPVGILMIAYSFTKRFTCLCHFVLGSLYFFLPIAGALAFGGELSPGLIALGLSAGLSISGSDMLYASQDTLFDRRFQLHSIPADFSIGFALKLAAGCHLAAAIILGAVLVSIDASLVSWLIFMAGLSLLVMKWRQIFTVVTKAQSFGLREEGERVARYFPVLNQLFGLFAVLPFFFEVVCRVLL